MSTLEVLQEPPTINKGYNPFRCLFPLRWTPCKNMHKWAYIRSGFVSGLYRKFLRIMSRRIQIVCIGVANRANRTDAPPVRS